MDEGGKEGENGRKELGWDRREREGRVGKGVRETEGQRKYR